MMHILGFLLSLVIGVSLGLMGSGGSILTVPLLLYCFGMDAAVATFYSLFIVGVASVAGAARFVQQKMVHLPAALLFGLPSLIGVFVARHLVLPALPEHLIQLSWITINKQQSLIILFALLMIAAAIKMIGKDKRATNNNEQPRYGLLILAGIGIGLFTGLVGAGGGFLMVPALVVLLKLPIKQAIGTSLVIIAINSLLGFASDVHHIPVAWPMLLKISAFATIGIFFGSRLAKKIDGQQLKPMFGWFILLMGIWMLAKEYPHLLVK